MRRLMTRRSLIGVVAVLLCASVLGWRIRGLARTPRVAASARVAQLMNNRRLALQIEAYAKRFDRPAYFLDSVVAHLDSADAAGFRRNLTDLWGGRVWYHWSWCDFTLVSRAGTTGMIPGMARDSLLRAMYARGRTGFPSEIDERYPWPAGVGRTQHCDAGP